MTESIAWQKFRFFQHLVLCIRKIYQINQSLQYAFLVATRQSLTVCLSFWSLFRQATPGLDSFAQDWRQYTRPSLPWSRATQSYRKLISHLENPMNSLIERKRKCSFVINIFESIFLHLSFSIHHLSLADKGTFPSLWGYKNNPKPGAPPAYMYQDTWLEQHSLIEQRVYISLPTFCGCL